jgi:hypothetical protein
MSDVIALRLAAGVDRSSAVHSVFRSAFNVSTGDGLLTIASTATGGLPNGIVADIATDFRTLGLRPGMAARATAAGLRVEAAGLAIDVDRAAAWSPRFARPIDGNGDAARVWRWRSHRVRSIAATVVSGRPTASAAGLGPILGTACADRDLGVVERAGPILARLETGLRRGDRAAAAAGARSLIGLGPGLTPSGDDALVGIEAAAWALEAPMAGFLAPALSDVGDRTTAVAGALLRHASAGEFSERLLDLLGALLGPDMAGIPAAIERAVAWGATSGSDCLVGVLLGLDAATDTTPTAVR